MLFWCGNILIAFGAKKGKIEGRLEEEEESEDEEPAKEEEEEAERCRQGHVVGQVSKRGVLWPGIKQTI